jgi:exopolysaccharide biosynthesis polyprenyl glycosylphosphotransferase
MTPPSAVGHAARSHGFPVRAGSKLRLAGWSAHLIGARSWARLRLLVDVVVLYLASSAALFAEPGNHVDTASRWLAAGFPLFCLAILHARRGPEERLHGSVLDSATHVLGMISLAAIMTIAISSVLGVARPMELPMRLWLFASVYLGLTRVMLMSIRTQAVRNPALATPTLIVGAGAVGEHLVHRLASDPGYGLRPVGFLDADPPARSDFSRAPLAPVLGRPDDLVDAVARTGARHVILAFSSEPDHRLLETVRQCQALDVQVSLVPRMFEAINERATLDHVGGLPLLSLKPTNPRGWEFAVKHAIDRTFAFVALLALAPLMGVLSLAVKLTSPGPILFRQRRVGRDGRVFDVLKYRTMRHVPTPTAMYQPLDGNGPGGIEGEDRRTNFGKWLRSSSLDELPQLINVLRGEMSLIGPRPERPEFVELFSAEVNRYQDRHRVKSGITGWAQVNGLRGQTSIADRVEWDNYYIENWSLRLDLRIVALTLGEILHFRG